MSARPLEPLPQFLFTSTHRSVRIDTLAQLVSVVRSAIAVSSLDDCARQYAAALRAMEPIPRARMSLLLDVRLAPLRNDAALEKTVAPYRAAMCLGFRRVATLVAGSLQHLQFARYGREDDAGMHVFDSEPQALAYLRMENVRKR